MSGKILEKVEVAPNIHRLVLDAPRIAKKALPGQFIMIVPDEVGERIPFTLSDWDAEAGTITVFFLEAGVSTMKLAKMCAGESVHVLVGPLGRPTEIDKLGTVLIGGGCYGLGAMYPLARGFKEHGNKVIGAIEARTEYVIYNEEKLKEVCDELIITTSDGSRGIKGHVRDVVDQLIKRGEKIDHAHFVGCTFMMMQSSKATSPHKVPTIVSLNALMVDGTGMCGCCRVNVGGETKFACVDGPDFDGHQVDWDMVASRAGAYVPDENLAYQFYHIKEDGAMKESQEHEEEVA
jgi:ferredoxin--NADP+ reductase